MDETETVEAKARDVAVVDKVLALLMRIIVRLPVAPDSHHLASALLNGHHIWQCNACLFAVVVLVLKAGQVKVNVHLQQLEPIVFRCAEAKLLSNLLLNLVHHVDGSAKLDLTVEARMLEDPNLVLRLTHDVGHALRRLKG